MKHIYISSIAILLLTPQLIFAGTHDGAFNRPWNALERQVWADTVEINLKKELELAEKMANRAVSNYNILNNKLTSFFHSKMPPPTEPKQLKLWKQALDTLSRDVKKAAAEVARLDQISRAAEIAAYEADEIAKIPLEGAMRSRWSATEQGGLREISRKYEERRAAGAIVKQGAKYGPLKIIGGIAKEVLPPVAAITDGHLLSEIFGDPMRRNFDAWTGADTVGTRNIANEERRIEEMKENRPDQLYWNEIPKFVPANPKPNF